MPTHGALDDIKMIPFWIHKKKEGYKQMYFTLDNICQMYSITPENQKSFASRLNSMQFKFSKFPFIGLLNQQGFRNKNGTNRFGPGFFQNPTQFRPYKWLAYMYILGRSSKSVIGSMMKLKINSGLHCNK